MSTTVVNMKSGAPLTALDQTDIEDTVPGGIAVDRLRSIIDRVERLLEERDALSNDIKDIWGEAKSAGFHVPALKALVSERRKDPEKVSELQMQLDLYRRAIGG